MNHPVIITPDSFDFCSKCEKEAQKLIVETEERSNKFWKVKIGAVIKSLIQ